MQKIISFFLKNSKLNYTLLTFILFLGVYSYIHIPKIKFPNVTENIINISGNYTGANATNLNSFAVIELENELENIENVEKIESSIETGYFYIDLYLNDSANSQEVLDDVKDAISKARSSLPNDMDEPIATISERKRSLMTFTISGDISKNKMIETSKNIQEELYRIKNINSVKIWGNTNLQIDIFLNQDKINLYKINSNKIINHIKNLSFIYPVASIEQQDNHIFINTKNDKLTKDFWLNSLISIDSKKIYLSDIANIKIHYPDKEIISRVNGERSLKASVYQNEKANAIELFKKIDTFLKTYEKNHKDIKLNVIYNGAKSIEDRLNTVISNIMLGLMLVGFSMYFLISPRISIVVTLGIPFSFIIGLIVLYYTGQSISMISLLGALICIGIITDDAIVVSENIQRYLDKGEKISEAVAKGTKEMIAPIMVASFTTVFAFLPMLYMPGRLGSFIVAIPLMVAILLFASLIESFLFLPLHAKHILRANEKALKWDFMYKFYEKILHILIHKKFLFVLVFVIAVPIGTYILLEQTKFQFFPKMDRDEIKLSIKINNSEKLENTEKISKIFEKTLLNHKKELSLKVLENFVGYYTNVNEETEFIENGFTIILRLEDYKDDNWIQNYLQPIFTFSFDFNQKEKSRKEKSQVISKKIEKLITPLYNKYDIIDKNLSTKRIGIVMTDLEFKLISKNPHSLLMAINSLEKELKKIDGVSNISNNATLDRIEYKIKLNSYGENLGLTESYVSEILNNYFIEKKQTKAIDSSGLVDIKTQSFNKDNFNSFKNFMIPLENNKFVELNEIIEYQKNKDFKTLEKENGKILKTIYGNVDTDKITSDEVIKKLTPLISNISKNNNVKIEFGGEFEQKEILKKELFYEFGAALFLIFLVLLINFPSFRFTFIILSVIPFTIFGALLGHLIMGLNLMMPSFIGMLGLAGVVINDGIIMLDFIKNTKTKEEFFARTKLRIRPILITSITTLLGLSTLIFYPSGQGVVLQPLAISLGFGLLWGTVLNLLYVPSLYAILFKIKD